MQSASTYNAEDILSFAAQLELTGTGSATARGIARKNETIYRKDGYFLAEAGVGSDGKTIIMDGGKFGSLSIEGSAEKTFVPINSCFRPVVGKQGVTLVKTRLLRRLLTAATRMTGGIERD